MNVQNVASALVNPKSITKNSYEPYLVQQTVFSSSLSAI
jgi:Holliday junction resolvasome RuvABC ATP-dependent DNA helicase subunit